MFKKDVTIKANNIESCEYNGGNYIRITGLVDSNDFNKEQINGILPKKYIINDNATILFWNDGTKTIVRKSKDDEYNKKLSFLWAYFQKNCGLSKNKANKYLEDLVDDHKEFYFEVFKKNYCTLGDGSK